MFVIEYAYAYWILNRSHPKYRQSEKEQIQTCLTLKLFIENFLEDSNRETEDIGGIESPWKRRKKKMSVQEYLDKHMLSRKIEDAVNAAVRAKTSDPVLFIVRFL